jgi:peptidoglycan/LPS O-acetylase OafA/YrhL
VDPIQSPVKRLFYLDTARGFAALSVALWHFFTALDGYTGSVVVNGSPLQLFWYADGGVLFFFIHSGFILTYSYANEKSRFNLPNYVRYLIERLFRIYPLFLFVLILSYVLQRTIYPLSGTSYLSGHLLQFWINKKDLAALAKEALLVIRLPDNANERLIPQDWTLTVELALCPFIPLLSLLWRKAKWFYWLVVLVLLKLVHVNTYLFEIASGVSIYFLWEPGKRVWAGMTQIVRVLAIVTGVALYTCFFNFSSLLTLDHMLFSPGIDRFIVVSGCALFFMIMISSPAVQRVLSHSALVRVGRCCYSLYLVHLLLLICFAGPAMRILHGWFEAPFWLYGGILLVVYLVATVGMSLLTYQFVEKPFNQLGKRISRRMESALGGLTR